MHNQHIRILGKGASINMAFFKKTTLMLKRGMHFLIFLNVLFAGAAFLLLYFAAKGIQKYVIIMYSYAPQLEDLESMLSPDLDIGAVNKLNETVAIINSAYNNIILITAVSILAFYLLWCFFQSLEWRVTYNSMSKAIRIDELFEKHWRYLLNFSIITIPAFAIITPASYFLLINSRPLFLNLIISMYGITEPLNDVSYALIVMLLLLVLMTSYFTMIAYIMLNRYKLSESIKKAFTQGIKRIHILLPIHSVCLIAIIPLIALNLLLIRLISFNAVAVISFLIYFAIVSYHQIALVALLEKS